MDERLRKELLRSELKERNNGKKIIRCKYRPKYPDSAEREYVRLINAYMTIEKEVLMKYIPEIKQILNDGTQLHTDSKKDNEKKRRTARFSALDNTIVRLTILFKTKICHGIQLNFGTREHALKSILTIDMMIRLGENLKHINENNAEN